MAKRKERCPYCTFRDVKDKVISHIERKHSELIPEGYTAARVLFNYINKKTMVLVSYVVERHHGMIRLISTNVFVADKFVKIN